MNEDVSKTITFLRFPLIFMVVIWHCYFAYVPMTDFPILNFVSCCLGKVVVRVSVPLFFVISGYLFFSGCEKQFDVSCYKQKIRKRVGTLFIPYILWTTIWICLYFVFYKIKPAPDGIKTVYDYSLIDFLFAFINADVIYDGKPPVLALLTESGLPLVGPFWFLRDLMVLCVCSPIIFYICKVIPKKIAFPFFLFFFVICKLTISGSNYLTSSLFYILGAYLSIKKVELLRCVKSMIPIYVYAVAIVIEIIFFNKLRNTLYHDLVILGGVVAFTCIAFRLTTNNKRFPEILGKSTFFVYAFHGLITRFLLPIIQDVATFNDIILTFLYLISPYFVTFICICVYSILLKFTPKTVAVLCGNRVGVHYNKL